MELAGQCRVTATFKRADGRTMNIRKATLPDPGQKNFTRHSVVPCNPAV